MRGGRLIHWTGLALAALAILAIVALFVVQTPWAEDRVRTLIVNRVSAAIDGDLRIARIDGSLLGDVTLHDVVLTHDGQPVFAADAVRVRYRPVRVWRDALSIDEVEITGPRVNLVEGADGWNVARLAKPRAPDAPPARIGFDIARLRLTDGTVDVRPAAGTARALHDLALDTSLAYRGGTLRLDVRRLAATDPATALALREVSADVTVGADGWHVEDLAATTSGGRMTGDVSGEAGTGLDGLTLDVTGDDLRPRAFQSYLPVLDRLPESASVDVTARGRGRTITSDLTLTSDEGGAKGTLTTTVGDGRVDVTGPLHAGAVNLAAWLASPDLRSRIDADLTIDARIPTDDPSAATVAFTASAPSVEVLRYRAARVRATGSWAGDRLSADASATAYGAQVTAHVSWTRPTGVLTASGRFAQADLRALPAFLSVPALASDLDGAYDVTGSAAGGWLATTTLDASTVEEARIAAGATARVDTRGDPIAWAFTGDVADAAVPRFAVVAPDAREAFERAGGPVSGHFDVDARGTSLADLAGRLEARLRDTTLSGMTIPTATVQADLADHALTATVQATVGGVTDATTGFSGAGAFSAHGTLDARVRLPDVTAATAPESLSGTATIDLDQAVLRGVALDRVRVQADVRDGVATLATGELRGDALTADVTGALAFAGDGQSDLRYSLTGVQLAALEPFLGRRVEGTLTTEGRLTGPARAPTASGTMNAQQLQSGDATALSVEGDYTVRVPDLDPARADVQATATASVVQAAGIDADKIQATVRYAEETLDLEATATQGAREIDVAGRLVPNPDEREVHLRRFSASFGGPTWQLQPGTDAVVRYGGDRLTISGITLTSGTASLRVAGTLGANAATPLQVTADQVPMAALGDLVPPERRVTGLFNGTVRADGPIDDPRVRAEFSLADGEVSGVAYQELRGTADLAAGRLGLDVRLEAGPLGRLVVSGGLPWGSSDDGGRAAVPYDLTVRSTAIDLGFFQPAVTALADLTGTGQFDLGIRGPAASPDLTGTATLTNAGFTVRATGISYRRFDAALTLADKTVRVDHLQLEDRDGNVATVQGELNVPAVGPPTGFELAITTSRLRVLENQYGEVAVSARLLAMGTLDTPLLNGTIRVDRGRIEASDLLDRLSARGYQPVPTIGGSGGGTPAGPWAQSSFSVTLDLPDNVVVRGRDLPSGSGSIGLGDINVTLGGALAIAKETGEEPTLRGRVDVVRGQYQFQGRRFDIQRGSEVRFQGPISNPTLDVDAQRVISGVTANVHLGGTLAEPQVLLSSTPPLDQGDILSLIVFNQTMNELPTNERVSLAARAGALAVGAIATPLADSVARALDLDMFEIRPSETATGASIVIGRQVSDRLFIGFSQDVGHGDASRVSFEYRLNQFLRIVTSFAQGGDPTLGAQRAEAAGIDLIYVIR
ncbi:MAG: translocation/assembly module TamB domain-containing protein [Vicinamibacterales bacterium]